MPRVKTSLFAPTIGHRADSLELVHDIVAAGLAVGLLPTGNPTLRGVELVPLSDSAVVLRAFAATRVGRQIWPPLALVLRLLTER